MLLVLMTWATVSYLTSISYIVPVIGMCVNINTIHLHTRVSYTLHTHIHTRTHMHYTHLHAHMITHTDSNTFSNLVPHKLVTDPNGWVLTFKSLLVIWQLQAILRKLDNCTMEPDEVWTNEQLIGWYFSCWYLDQRNTRRCQLLYWL